MVFDGTSSDWNNGENIELVLRRQDGSFAPLQWVLMVFCHELAHIKHMNHVPSLHGKLDRELRQECKDLQGRGYYGDGFWSAGQRLQDNAFVQGSGMNQLQGLPQYSCGGAYRNKSKARRPRRSGAGTKRKRGFQGPSLHTGAQTARNLGKSRRIGHDLPGQGTRVDSLNEIPTASAFSKSYKDDPNSTFRKRAQSKAARELRAEAALRRLGASQPIAVAKDESKPLVGTLADWALPKTTVPTKSEPKPEPGVDSRDAEELTDSGSDDDDEGFVVLDEQESDDKGKQPELELSTQASRESEAQRRERARLYRQHERAQDTYTPQRTTVQEWGDFFLAPAARPPTNEPVPSEDTNTIRSKPEKESRPTSTQAKTTAKRAPPKMTPGQAIEISDSDSDEPPVQQKSPPRQRSPPPPMRLEWECLVCTLLNPPSAERCDACDTTRGCTLLGE